LIKFIGGNHAQIKAADPLVLIFGTLAINPAPACSQNRHVGISEQRLAPHFNLIILTKPCNRIHATTRIDFVGGIACQQGLLVKLTPDTLNGSGKSMAFMPEMVSFSSSSTR
jgi:hypothetical protein